MALSHSVRDLLPLKSLIKEGVDKSGMKSEKMEFVSSSTVYEYNNGAIVVEASPSMTPTSNQIVVKYH